MCPFRAIVVMDIEHFLNCTCGSPQQALPQSKVASPPHQLSNIDAGVGRKIRIVEASSDEMVKTRQPGFEVVRASSPRYSIVASTLLRFVDDRDFGHTRSIAIRESPSCQQGDTQSIEVAGRHHVPVRQNLILRTVRRSHLPQRTQFQSPSAQRKRLRQRRAAHSRDRRDSPDELAEEEVPLLLPVVHLRHIDVRQLKVLGIEAQVDTRGILKGSPEQSGNDEYSWCSTRAARRSPD